MIVKHLCTFSDFRIKEFPVLKLIFRSTQKMMWMEEKENRHRIYKSQF